MAATTSLMQCAPPVIVQTNTWKQTLKHFKPTICTDTTEGTTKYEYCFHNLFWMLHKFYPISKKNHGRWTRMPTCPSSNAFGTFNKCSGNFQGWLNEHVGNVASLVSSVTIYMRSEKRDRKERCIQSAVVLFPVTSPTSHTGCHAANQRGSGNATSITFNSALFCQLLLLFFLMPL